MATARPIVLPTHAPDAIALLKADHVAVAALFAQYEKSKGVDRDDGKAKLAEQICEALTLHMKLEEKIFYPACDGVVAGTTALLAEARVEHGTLKEMIKKIQSGEAGSGEYDACVKVLAEYVTHHVKEEHDDLFPKVKASDLDLKALGERLAEMKGAHQPRK